MSQNEFFAIWITCSFIFSIIWIFLKDHVCKKYQIKLRYCEKHDNWIINLDTFIKAYILLTGIFGWLAFIFNKFSGLNGFNDFLEYFANPIILFVSGVCLYIMVCYKYPNNLKIHRRRLMNKNIYTFISLIILIIILFVIPKLLEYVCGKNYLDYWGNYLSNSLAILSVFASIFIYNRKTLFSKKQSFIKINNEYDDWAKLSDKISYKLLKLDNEISPLKSRRKNKKRQAKKFSKQWNNTIYLQLNILLIQASNHTNRFLELEDIASRRFDQEIENNTQGYNKYLFEAKSLVQVINSKYPKPKKFHNLDNLRQCHNNIKYLLDSLCYMDQFVHISQKRCKQSLWNN